MAIEELLRTFFFYCNPEPGRETISIKGGKADEHLTIQPLWNKRIVEVHRTKELSKGVKEHTTLFVVSFFTIGRFLVQVRRGSVRLQNLVRTEKDLKDHIGIRRINAGFLRRKGMLTLTTDQEVLAKAGLIRWENRGKKLRMGKRAHLIDPATLFLEIDAGLAPGQYILMRPQRRSPVFAGILTVVQEKDRKRFVLFPKNALNRMAKLLMGASLDKMRNASFEPMNSTVDL